ncbi:MAG: hypothetical protein LUD77_04360 [Clostridiales bacterium]|nr:hypothetical protein [Clostridiales bacterium]
MAKIEDFSYPNSNGKIVSGTAAFLHFVYTEIGGMEKYVKSIENRTAMKCLMVAAPLVPLVLLALKGAIDIAKDLKKN